MDQISSLQKQYPLSPKKFWKKMFDKLIGWYVIIGLGVIIDIIIMLMGSSSYDKTSSLILWGALVAGLLLLIILTSVFSWYIKTYIKRYYYDGEDNFITIKKGVFAPSEIHVQWQKIQDV